MSGSWDFSASILHEPIPHNKSFMLSIYQSINLPSYLPTYPPASYWFCSLENPDDIGGYSPILSIQGTGATFWDQANKLDPAKWLWEHWAYLFYISKAPQWQLLTLLLCKRTKVESVFLAFWKSKTLLLYPVACPLAWHSYLREELFLGNGVILWLPLNMPNAALEAQDFLSSP